MSTASSRKALAMQHLRTAFSESPTFQTWVGMDGDPDPPAASLSRIHCDALPRDANAVHTRTDLENERPYVILRDETTAKELESQPATDQWVMGGTISATFVANADELANNWDVYFDFINPVDAIIDELCQASLTPGQLAFQSVFFEEGTGRAAYEEIPQMGDFIFAEAMFVWRAGR